jgi:hypothetical protein
MSKPQMQRLIAEEQALEFPGDDQRCAFEGGIQIRLQELTNLVEDFASSALSLFRIEKTVVREAIEELIVKEAALRWIVGVASRSVSPVREQLWADIDRSLSDLEKTAESALRAGTKRSRSNFNDHDNRVIYLA